MLSKKVTWVPGTIYISENSHEGACHHLAMEMSSIYSSILTGSMDAYAAIISNNMNIVMKFLTSVTIVLSLPTIIASIYGMNVGLPFQHSPFAFAGIMGVTLGLGGVVAYSLYRWNMF